MPDCRFEEYFLPATPETTFGDETLAGPNLSARAWRYKRYPGIKTGTAINWWMAIPVFILG